MVFIGVLPNIYGVYKMWFFKLKEHEAERANRFMKRHDDHAGAFSYIFTVTKGSADFISRIRCNRCNKSENITEFGAD
jgi:hypothetical protein